MRILVTGATGFIGRVASRVLVEHGNEVVGLTRRIDGSPLADGVTELIGWLEDQGNLAQALAAQRFDAVVHLAGVATARDSFGDPGRYYTANVGGTAHLLRNVRAPVVFASTCMVYGAEGRLDETAPLRPAGPYGSSKLAAEDCVRYVCMADGLEHIVLRLFNVAGADRGVVDYSPTRIVGNAVRAAADLIPQVRINGDGSAVREFTHVLDIADAIRRAVLVASGGESHTLNIGTGAGVTVDDVISAAERIAGVRVEVEYGPPVAEPGVLVSDSSLAQRVLGWTPERSDLGRIVGDVWEHRRLLR